MNKRLLLCGILIWGVTALLAAGCTITRANGAAGDIAGYVPPPQTAAAAQEPAVQTGAVIRLQPAGQQLQVGGTTTVEIWVDNITNLFSVDIELRFDPGLLRVIDADPEKQGDQIQPGTFLPPDFVVSNVADNTTGVISYVLTQLAPGEPVSGNGLLATITFRGVAPGSSPLTFTTVKLANADAQLLDVASQAGQVTVEQMPETPVAGASPTPTLTLEPGVTPTLTPTPTPSTPTPALSPTPTITPTALPAPSPTPPPPTPTPSPLPPTSTPLPPTTRIPPGATVGFCYRVGLNDTLYSVGQKFGVQPRHIQIANDLYPPGHIFANQAIFIPEQMGNGPNVYVMKPGDTLAAIAGQCHLPVDHLAFVNNIAVDSVLQPGHVLYIPLPPFPPPSRYPYPPVVSPPVPPWCGPPQCAP